MRYTKWLLITKLIFIGIEYNDLKEVSCTYDGSIKLGKEIKLSQHISKQPKNQMFSLSKNHCRNNQAYRY